MTKPPAYQHYAQDWIAGTAHLSLEAQGAYLRLLDHQWIDGPLPNDMEHLSELVGLTRQKFAKVWRRLSKHFPMDADGNLANKRLEMERKKQADYRMAQAEAGRIGAAKRWHPEPMPTPMALGMAENSSSSSSSFASIGHTVKPVISNDHEARSRAAGQILELKRQASQ